MESERDVFNAILIPGNELAAAYMIVISKELAVGTNNRHNLMSRYGHRIRFQSYKVMVNLLLKFGCYPVGRGEVWNSFLSSTKQTDIIEAISDFGNTHGFRYISHLCQLARAHKLTMFSVYIRFFMNCSFAVGGDLCTWVNFESVKQALSNEDLGNTNDDVWCFPMEEISTRFLTFISGDKSFGNASHSDTSGNFLPIKVFKNKSDFEGAIRTSNNLPRKKNEGRNIKKKPNVPVGRKKKGGHRLIKRWKRRPLVKRSST
ncbi:MAG: hypothetical protein ACRDL7_01170 [Gaiellaceae bacterium]